jgi:hypothetical protein
MGMVIIHHREWTTSILQHASDRGCIGVFYASKMPKTLFQVESRLVLAELLIRVPLIAYQLLIFAVAYAVWGPYVDLRNQTFSFILIHPVQSSRTARFHLWFYLVNVPLNFLATRLSYLFAICTCIPGPEVRFISPASSVPVRELSFCKQNTEGRPMLFLP